MRIPRLFLPGLPPGGEVELDRRTAHHALRVLRLQAGDLVSLFDGKGREVAATLTAKGALLQEEIIPLDRQLPIVIAACSPPRGQRLEYLIEKAVELGLTEFFPVLTTRTPPAAKKWRPDRLEKAAIQAAEQCGRAQLPIIMEPQPLAVFLDRRDLPGNRYLLAQDGDQQVKTATSEAVYLAGPEGGFTDAEIAAAKAAGYQPLCLSPMTLRIETAILAAIATTP